MTITFVDKLFLSLDLFLGAIPATNTETVIDYGPQKPKLTSFDADVSKDDEIRS